VADRTPAQVGAANRRRGKQTEQMVARFLESYGIGNGRRNLAGYARDHGDYGPIRDRDGDAWGVEIKGWQDPTPAKIEAAAKEAAREAEHAGAPYWVLVVRRPGCAEVSRWWAVLPVMFLIELVDGAWTFGNDELVQVPLAVWAALVAPETF